jgi:adenylylsulfate kinase
MKEKIKKVYEYETSTYERSFLKGFIWEVISFIIVLIAVYAVYGNLETSIFFSVILTLVKTPIFFLHERIWKKIKWGKCYYVKK